MLLLFIFRNTLPFNCISQTYPLTLSSMTLLLPIVLLTKISFLIYIFSIRLIAIASPKLQRINASAPFAIARASLRGFQPVTSMFGAVSSFSSSPSPIHINRASGTNSAIRLKSCGCFWTQARPSVKTVNLSLCTGSIPSSEADKSAKFTPVSI